MSAFGFYSPAISDVRLDHNSLIAIIIEKVDDRKFGNVDIFQIIAGRFDQPLQIVLQEKISMRAFLIDVRRDDGCVLTPGYERANSA